MVTAQVLLLEVFGPSERAGLGVQPKLTAFATSSRVRRRVPDLTTPSKKEGRAFPAKLWNYSKAGPKEPRPGGRGHCQWPTTCSHYARVIAKVLKLTKSTYI